jgi:hypothetical protein
MLNVLPSNYEILDKIKRVEKILCKDGEERTKEVRGKDMDSEERRDSAGYKEGPLLLKSGQHQTITILLYCIVCRQLWAPLLSQHLSLFSPQQIPPESTERLGSGSKNLGQINERPYTPF